MKGMNEIYFSGTTHQEGPLKGSSVFGTSSVWSVLTWYNCWKISLLDYLESMLLWMGSCVGHMGVFCPVLGSSPILFVNCAYTALRRHCATAMFFFFWFFFSILLLHVCYVCIAVSQRATSALKMFRYFSVVVFLTFLICLISWDVDAFDLRFDLRSDILL